MSEIGFERKIGYSFLGLMAGNAVTLAAFVLWNMLGRLDAFADIRKFWIEEIIGTLGLFLMIWVVSMLGWVVVGLPVVLSLRTRTVAEFHGITAALIGAVLGLAAMLLSFLVMNGGKLDTALLSNPQAARATAFYFCGAALISDVAFAVYCALVKAALRKQTRKSDVPSGTPRSLAWFDF